MVRRLIALSLALLAAFAGGWIGWALVRRDVLRWESAGFGGGPELSFVVFLAVAASVAVGLLAWRRLVGPALEHAEWSLVFPSRARPRLAEAVPRVADLLAPLERLGYALDATLLDDAGAPLGPADPDRPLAGTSLRLVERRLGPRRGGVVLRVPPARADTPIALGFLDVHGALDGPYDELAHFLVATLGDLEPGVTFKRMDSALEAEPATSVREQLPDRPERLPR